MNKSIVILVFSLSACTSLNYQEKTTLRELKAKGITVNTPRANWERPKNPATAGILNLLPGMGNFYLSSSDDSQYIYGFVNLVFWPTSIFWSIPEAIIDAKRINERELVYFYTFDKKIPTTVENSIKIKPIKLSHE